MLKRLLSVVVGVAMFVAVLFALPVSAKSAKDVSNDEQVFDTATIDDNFADDCVIVELLKY